MDQKFEKRRRIAEGVLRELRKAGYSGELADDCPARTLKREH